MYHTKSMIQCGNVLIRSWYQSLLSNRSEQSPKDIDILIYYHVPTNYISHDMADTGATLHVSRVYSPASSTPHQQSRGFG